MCVLSARIDIKTIPPTGFKKKSEKEIKLEGYIVINLYFGFNIFIMQDVFSRPTKLLPILEIGI